MNKSSKLLLVLLLALILLPRSVFGDTLFPAEFSVSAGKAEPSSASSGNRLEPNQTLELNRAVDLALQDNFTLKAAREQITQAEARLGQAQSLKNFKAKIEGQSVVQGPEINIPMPNLDIVLQSKYNTSGRLAVENLLTTFGKVENQIVAAFFQVQAQNETYAARQSELTLETQKTYFNILKSASALSVAEEYLHLTGEYQVLAQEHHRQGVVSNYDVLRAGIAVEEASKNKISAQKALEMSKSTLLFLIGNPEEIPYQVQNQPPQVPPENLKLAELQTLALENRHELKTMNYNLAAARAVLKAAQSLNRPDLVLLSEYDCQTMKVTFMPQYNWSAGVGIRIPLLDGGESAAKVKEAASAVRQLENAKLGLEQQIKLEVKNAWLSVQESSALIKVQIKETQKNQEGYRLAKARYTQGVSLAVEMDEALASYHNARKNLVDSTYDLNLAASALEKTVGSKIPGRPMEIPDFTRLDSTPGGN